MCKKHIFVKLSRLFSVFAVIFGISSCSSEGELPVINGDRTFSGTNLSVLYCGQPMPGKQVAYIPGDKMTNGAVVCKGITNLDQLSSIGLSGTGAAPGVLPGSGQTEWDVSLYQGPDFYFFRGEGSTDYLSNYKYYGRIYSDSCTLDISEVELANSSLSNTVWHPSPIKRDGMEYSSFPFHLVWEIDPSIGIDIDLSGLLKFAASYPAIPVYHNTAYSSLAQLYTNAVQTVAFKDNGNIIIRYYSSVGGATQLITSNGNTFQYVLPADYTMLLYPNPTTLFGRWLVAQSNAGDDPNISFSPHRSSNESTDLSPLLLGIIKELIPLVLNLTSEGIELTVARSDSGLSIYLDTQTTLYLMGQIFETIEKDPTVKDQLLGWINANPEFPISVEQINEIITNLQTIMANTTKFEIGLNFDLYK